MRKKSILIIDDEIDIGEVLATLLEDEFDCKFVADGKVAIDMIHSQPFDAVITDLEMPGTSGLTILREVIAQKKKIPLFISTGHDFEHPKVQAAMGAGACDILFKPFLEPDKLIKMIAPHLN